ncbi:MAG: DUF3899 domain-containing protein [Erysipelotrichales bacterium]|nr:DUF3899 domain-containing protein [Erysipelotrichales bacterium]
MLKRFFFHSKQKYLTLIIACVLINLIFISFSFNDISIRTFEDSFFVTAILMFGGGGFSFINYHGGFHMFGYTGQYMKNLWGKAKYNHYHEYIVAKNEDNKNKKYNFGPYLFIGFFFLILSLLLSFFV